LDKEGKRRTKFLAIILLPLLIFLAIPPDLLQDVSFSRSVNDRSGELLRLTLAKDQKYRLFVPLQNISPLLIKSVLLHEDKYFYSHPGVNPIAVAQAAWRHLGGSGRGGASTITMQTVRLKSGIHSKNILGKMWQMLQAFRLELHYSKNHILEAYLNLAPYGGNVEGVGAASHIYFSRNVDALSLPEALTLAVIPQSPAKRMPNAKNEQFILQARERLFNKWVKDSPQDIKFAGLISRKMQYKSKGDLPFIAPQYTSRLLKQSGKNNIIATLDKSNQELLTRILKGYVNHRLELGIANASAMLVDINSREVIASVGSVNYFDLLHQGMLDGTKARRSPGSALKPFIYALAFEQGIIHPMSLLRDVKTEYATYAPENYDHDYQGPLSAHDALIKSRNIPALWVAEQLKKPSFYDFLGSANIDKLKTQEAYGLSLVLGGAEVTMQELVGLYAMLADNGNLKNLIYQRDEKPLAGKQLLSPEAAFLTLDILKDNPPPGGSLISDNLHIPVYWKTGTSGGLRDAWSVGIFGHYVLAVWTGDFRGSRHGQYVGYVTAAPLFFEIVRAVTAKENLVDIIQAKSNALNIRKTFACSDTGDINNIYCPVKQPVWIIPGISPIKSSDIYRRVAINDQTGKIACKFVPGKTSYRVVEFWSSELSEVFAKAGIKKTPPPQSEENCGQSGSSGVASPPHIISPAKNLSYHINPSKEENKISLKASFDAGVESAFWFVDNIPVGRAKPDETIFWELKHGNYIVRVIDDKGNSDSRNLSVD